MFWLLEDLRVEAACLDLNGDAFFGAIVDWLEVIWSCFDVRNCCLESVAGKLGVRR